MAEQKDDFLNRRCSFCGRHEIEVELLIPSNNNTAFICNDCIDICANFLDENLSRLTSSETGELSFETLPRPQSIKAKLDEYVIGQEAAKIALSVAVYNHYKRILTLKKNKTGRRNFKSSEES